MAGSERRTSLQSCASPPQRSPRATLGFGLRLGAPVPAEAASPVPPQPQGS
jgi:hypothetical protein